MAEDSPIGFTPEEMAAQKIVAGFRNAKFRSKEEAPKEGDSRAKLGEEGQEKVAEFVEEIRGKRQPTFGERREKAVEAGKKKAGELVEIGREKAAQLAAAGREKAPVVRAKAQEAAKKFSLVIEDVIIRAEPKMAALIERGKKVLGKVKETDPREALASLIDLPANFTEMAARYVEDVALQRERKAKKLEAEVQARDKERKEKEKAFNAEMKALKKEWGESKAAHKAQWVAQANEVEAELVKRQDRIEDMYRSYKSFPKIAEKRQKELEVLKSWRDERAAQSQARFEEALADEEARLVENAERLKRKFERRIERAIGRSKKAETRASRAREEANVVWGFSDTWRARARRMRGASDTVAAFLGT